MEEDQKKLKGSIPGTLRKNRKSQKNPKRKKRPGGAPYLVDPVKPPEPKIEITFQECGLVGEIKRSRGISWNAAEKVFLAGKRARLERRKNAQG